MIGMIPYNRYRDKTRFRQAIAEIRVLERHIYMYEGYAGNLPDRRDKIGEA
jgi:hypothetical protein